MIKTNVHIFDSSEGYVNLDEALVTGLSPEIAKEVIDWIFSLQEESIKPHICVFCGNPVP